ncbi:MAG: hypothetical protein HY394_02795 [Candidatus Diapherotrites archaeon]|nr:hypothetical protein [Candidatus Diapherotrites archaeon]
MSNDRLAPALKTALLFAFTAFLALVFLFPATNADECCFYPTCTDDPCPGDATCCNAFDCGGYQNLATCLPILTPCTPYDTCSDPTVGLCGGYPIVLPCTTGKDNDGDGEDDQMYADINIVRPEQNQVIFDKNITFEGTPFYCSTDGNVINSSDDAACSTNPGYDLNVFIQRSGQSLEAAPEFNSRKTPYPCRLQPSGENTERPLAGWGAPIYCEYDENVLLDRTSDYNIVVRAYQLNSAGAELAIIGQDDRNFAYVDNKSPSVSALYLTKSSSACTSTEFATSATSVSGFTPGTDYLCLKATVFDWGGNPSIDLANSRMLLWSNAFTLNDADSGNAWDRHRTTSFFDCSTGNSKTSMALADENICGQIPPDPDLTSDSGISVKDVNGNYGIGMIAQDYTGNSANTQSANAVAMNTTIGISLDRSSCTFEADADTNIALSCGGSPAERIIVTHTGNIEEKVYAYMSTTFSSPDFLEGDSIYWKASQIGTPSTTDINANSTSITNTNCVSRILNNWGRGTVSTSTAAAQDTYWYMAIPKIESGTYSGGVITMTAYAQATACS